MLQYQWQECAVEQKTMSHRKIAVRQVFDEMTERDVVSWNSIVNGYVKVGEVVVGQQLFDEMPQRNLVGWNVMVTGPGLNGNIATIVVALTACAPSARMNEGKSVHGMLVKNIVCWNVMILGYCIHGNPTDGLNLCADLVSSSLEDTEIDHVKNMKQGEGDHVLPDEITFVGVLCACAREGLVTEARTYFGDTSDLFGVKPNFAHH
ncbi:hypothetical protein KY284_033835 [Solanum tuberosum]|nr:hypothetical protein KY284_033835 [Solanum tuberosum]